MNQVDAHTDAATITPEASRPLEVHPTRSVSFSSEVSVFTEDDNITIASADGDDDEQLMPKSLFSGRWIGDIGGSDESRGVAIVEINDHNNKSLAFPDSATRDLDVSPLGSPLLIGSDGKHNKRRSRLSLDFPGDSISPIPLNDSSNMLQRESPDNESCREHQPQSFVGPQSPLEGTYNLGMLNAGILGDDHDTIDVSPRSLSR